MQWLKTLAVVVELRMHKSLLSHWDSDDSLKVTAWALEYCWLALNNHFQFKVLPWSVLILPMNMNEVNKSF